MFGHALGVRYGGTNDPSDTAKRYPRRHPRIRHKAWQVDFPDFSIVANILTAPILYLHPDDRYKPSDILAQVQNTIPKNKLDNLPPNANLPELNLDNLDVLNNFANGGVDINLSSKDNIEANPSWLDGAPVMEDGSSGEAKTSVVIIAEKDQGIIDAFYLTFYAYNWGGIVLGQNLGNHVGDW